MSYQQKKYEVWEKVQIVNGKDHVLSKLGNVIYKLFTDKILLGVSFQPFKMKA
ncbi:MAG: hypothetical protein M0R21_07205 [Lentimicrobiaceae bacterium]|nr:hypothetical protein [Lentimicrobiaceae bacterium]